mgnify:CR=1 FL=1
MQAKIVAPGRAKPEGRRDARRRLVRQALLRAAQELMEAGAAPTVTEAADRAGVARATAYRHFSTPEQLATEAALDLVAARASGMRIEPGAAGDPEDAAALLVRRVLGMVIENEAAFRRMLAHAVEGAAPRGGRRIDWIRAAFAPHAAALTPQAVERLVPALALLTGIETLVVFCDVCGRDRDEAVAAAEATARALVRAALGSDG